MFQLSGNLELLFGEPDADGRRPDIARRVRAAAAAGLPAVEIWDWRDKDLDALAAALTETGTVLQTMCTTPMGHLVDPATHPVFLAALAESAPVAERLGCPYLVVTAGDVLPGVPRADQHRAIAGALKAAAVLLDGRPVTLLLENLNSRVDHIGTFLDSTTEVLDLVEEADSPRVRLLYDHYHSLAMGEDPAEVLAGRVHLLAHVQTADVPGRHEPGTADVDWPAQLATLYRLGYRGRIGLEYLPVEESTRSLAGIRQVLAELGTSPVPEER